MQKGFDKPGTAKNIGFLPGLAPALRHFLSYRIVMVEHSGAGDGEAGPGLPGDAMGSKENLEILPVLVIIRN